MVKVKLLMLQMLQWHLLLFHQNLKQEEHLKLQQHQLPLLQVGGEEEGEDTSLFI